MVSVTEKAVSKLSDDFAEGNRKGTTEKAKASPCFIVWHMPAVSSMKPCKMMKSEPLMRCRGSVNFIKLKETDPTGTQRKSPSCFKGVNQMDERSLYPDASQKYYRSGL